MPLKPQSAKGKGRRLQQEVRDLILETFTELEEDDVRSTSMGSGGEDLLLSPAARKKFNYSVECKNTEKLNIWGALKQADANAKEGTPPLVIFKRNRSKTYAVLELKDLLELVSRLESK